MTYVRPSGVLKVVPMLITLPETDRVKDSIGLSIIYVVLYNLIRYTDGQNIYLRLPLFFCSSTIRGHMQREGRQACR